MSLSWKPRFEVLETREVPAIAKLIGVAIQQVIYEPADPTLLPPPPPPPPPTPGGAIVIVLPPSLPAIP